MNEEDVDDFGHGADLNNSEISEISSTTTTTRTINRQRVYKPCTVNFALTNARSLTPKVDSMIETFCELDLSTMLVSESWLKKGSSLDNCLTDLEHAENLSLIHKSRASRKGKNAGGGVCIVFDKTKIALKEYPVKAGRSEFVVACGKVANIQRKFVFISAYISPRTKAKQTRETLKNISDAILKAKSELPDPIIIIIGPLLPSRM